MANQMTPMTSTGPVGAHNDTGMSEFGRYLRDAARTLERWSHYVSTRDMRGIRRDVESRVREYPVGTLVLGFGTGFLLGKMIG